MSIYRRAKLTFIEEIEISLLLIVKLNSPDDSLSQNIITFLVQILLNFSLE